MRPVTGPFAVERSNTILYCDRWVDTVAFYRDVLDLPVVFSNDWFVEFAVHDESYLSVADAERATITAGHGAGITISWRVADVGTARDRLDRRDVVTSEPVTRWGADTVVFHDPEGNRIELWAPRSARG